MKLKKRILITGATGFVGMQIVKYLSKKNIDLYLIIRDTHPLSFESNPSIKSIIKSDDLFSETSHWWKSSCEGMDAVMHLAWYAEPGKYLQSSLNRKCQDGTIEMAKGVIEAGVKKFIGIGTCFEYKFKDTPLGIDSPLEPKTPYATAKVETFRYLEKYFKDTETDFLWCRLFYLYGEGEDERRLVPFLINNLSKGKSVELSSGDKIKDYLDVAKAGEIISNLALSGHTGPYNVCSGKGISIKSLAESIADRYNRRDLLKFGNPKVNNLDPDFIVGKKTDPNF